MACCGRKPDALPATARPATVPAAPPWVQPDAAGAPRHGAAPAVNLRCIAHGTFHVRGPATGRLYAFSDEHATRAVDARDAAALLRSRHFVRA